MKKNQEKQLEKLKTYFGPGPASIPYEVLEAAAAAVKSYAGSALSILEIPHRSPQFLEILENCNLLVRELCGLDADFHVLWLHGGGRLQFVMAPMNFAQPNRPAAYIDSGHWSYEAIQYAKNYSDVDIIASSRDINYAELPTIPSPIDPAYSYVHYTTNNTIYGTQWHSPPVTQAPLVADMSSDILSRPFPYSNHALIYAVAQKNLGAAGATLVIVRKDMLDRAHIKLPPMMHYAAHVANKSVLNTPPVFAIYTALLMLQWTQSQGQNPLYERNTQKAKLLYAEIDRNPLFYGTVRNPEHRSQMNVCFRGISPLVEAEFAAFADQAGLIGLEGHRSVGGFRASIYNAVTLRDVKALVVAMQQFAHERQDLLSAAS